ncbi:terminase small subunit [Bacillus infantis]|nr:terminase small subunit [Bacillus infantis]
MADEKRKVGRPLKFESVEALEDKIEAYFTKCDEKEEPYTITGLALALDTSRKVLLEYQDKDEYSNTIKRAKLRCENFAESFLFRGKSVVGGIFNLKNNYGWVDQQVIKNETSDDLSDDELNKRLKELQSKLDQGK